MPQQELGATEWLANLSVGYIVFAALVLTVIRVVLAPNKAAWARSIAELVESLIVAGVLVFLIIRPFFVQAFFIPSESMEPTLMGHEAGYDTTTNTQYDDSVHDHIFVNKLIYRLHPPQRGDIVVFRAPGSADVNHQGVENVLIKRLIAVPGDTIQVKPDDQRVTRVWLDKHDGKGLQPQTHETYINHAATPAEAIGPQDPGALFAVSQPLTLKANEVFVMGDNRNYSNDSRFWGPLTEDRIMGKAMFIFWPIARMRVLH